ncbi:MAG TPA: hypothetical protein VMS12_05180 [Thermoanaerobaculia bacterium]|nr:hypothetical protein [Thermoanaerobaculia bacterium]
MMQFDNEVKQALQRMDPPDGFADRVMARIASEGQRSEAPAGSMIPISGRWWRSLAAAALVTVLIGAGLYQMREQRAERREGLRARQEVLLALSIASEKTKVAREAVTEP